MNKVLNILILLLGFSSISIAQTQESEQPKNEFQEMMKQMEEMMKSFPIDSISFPGMEEMQNHLGNIDFDTIGGHMQSIMGKMEEIFKDIDFSSIEKEFKQMEDELRKQLPNDGDSNSKEQFDSNSKSKKKRKVTKL